MTHRIAARFPTDRRTEDRHLPKKFYSVEMKLAGLPIYQFKLKDVSENGVCFMVKEDSAILEYLEVGLLLDMRYYSEDKTEPSKIFRSEIKHITKAIEKPYKGHYMIGVMILENQIQQDAYSW
jgi:hypothetical protein